MVEEAWSRGGGERDWPASTPATHPGLQAVLAWAGSLQASTPLHFAVAPSTPSAAAMGAWGGGGTWVPSEGAWLTRWPLEAGWGHRKGAPPSGGSSGLWCLSFARRVGSHCQARQGAHTLDPEVLSFSYFLNFETFQTPIKVEGTCRQHHISLT